MGLEILEMMFGDVLDRKEGLLDTYTCIYVTKRFSLIAILDFYEANPWIWLKILNSFNVYWVY